MSKLKEALEFDALDTAEKITGNSYKIDKSTESLGFGLMLANNQRKEVLLKEQGDSGFSNTVVDYVRIIESIGFVELLKLPFVNTDGIEENFYIFWNYEHSVMIKFDTHTWGDDGSWGEKGVPPPNVNGGSMLYNWKPNEDINYYDYTSSGGFNGDIYVGSHDCREAIKFKFNNLLNNGTFINDWVDQPWLWLLHYMDTKDKGYDHNAINEERISKLPITIQKIIKS